MVAGALLAGTLALPAAAETPQDNPAVHTRKLQTELMVAALYCSQHARYNAFVRRFEGELVASGRQLRAMFIDLHGSKRGTAQLDTFLTKMANEESQRRIRVGARYCTEARQLFAQVLSLPTRQLFVFASTRATAARADARVSLLRTPGY